MIGMEFIKTDPDKVPPGYGPRIWIKFPHHPATSKDSNVAGVFAAMDRLCMWGGADKSYRQEANESNSWDPPIVLSWEFPSANPKLHVRWIEALEALKAYGAKEIFDPVQKVVFFDGFFVQLLTKKH